MNVSWNMVALSWCLLPALINAADLEPKQSAAVASTSNSQGTELRSLLREVGGRTHRHFVLDPRAPQVIDLGSLDRQDLSYPQLLSVLQVNGMVVVADDGIMQVIPNTDVRQAALPVVPPENIKALDDEWITTIVPVKGINASQLVPLLRPMIPQWGHLAALPERNALLIVDRSANVRRLVEVIRIFESAPKVADASPSKSP